MPEDPKRLFDYVSPFFLSVAGGLRHLQNRITVEVICGELVQTSEEIRYDLLQHREKTDENWVTSAFPDRYDRIHLNHVP